MSADRACRYLVRGRVQGVGFRWFVLRVATGLKLQGYVRNLPDGQVEVCASGPRESLDVLEREIATGPPAARVEHVEKRELSHEVERFNSFEVR